MANIYLNELDMSVSSQFGDGILAYKRFIDDSLIIFAQHIQVVDLMKFLNEWNIGEIRITRDDEELQ